MSMKTIQLFAAVLFLAATTSCVSSKVHKELQGEYDILSTEASGLRKANADFEVLVREQLDAINRMKKQVEALISDTTALGSSMRDFARKNEKLDEQYNMLLTNNKSLVARSAQENKALMEELEILQSRLQAKEDSLVVREKRLYELENAIARKDSAMNYLQNKVAEALLGFTGKGLTIYNKNGRVYVSMENSLLFASGSYDVAPKGKEALTGLAKVLADNPDISILVEGHTDNDPYRGTGLIKDNWDLSVMRATSVVKILTDGANLKQDNITAAGRGEYFPLVPNNSAENKAKNRRTEIILTPNLNELLQILGN